MRNDPQWIVRYVWYKRTGSPPLEYDEFRPAEIPAFLMGIDSALEEEDKSAYTKRRWGPPRNIKLPSQWNEAVSTGDPLIDKWEREIAAGKTPNLTENLP